MPIEDADALQELFEQQKSVTTMHEQSVQSEIELYRALRETDELVLTSRAEWSSDRQYYPDPLAEAMSEAFADMLFGEPPVVKAAATVALEKERSTKLQEITKQAREEANQPPPPPTPPTPPTPGQPPTPPAPTPPPPPPPSDGPPVEPNIDLNPEKTGDQERIDDIVDANDLASELHFAEVICSSEGEVWWRIYTDLGQSEFPIIEWSSRAHVRPMFKGRKLQAAAFVEEIHREQVRDQWILYRYVQIHAEGVIKNLLYRGDLTNLGLSVPLTDRPETETLQDEWQHDFGMMCGRIINKRGRDRRLGVSDYRSIKKLLFSLNEATTIGHENARLTAKKRIAVPREALSEDGTFDAGEDVLVVDTPLDDQLGANTGGGKFAVLEYSFDSAALIDHKLDLISTATSRVGLVAEFINSGNTRGSVGNAAISGTALRMRLIPTTLASNGKGRQWDEVIGPKILLTAQSVDAAPEEQGGFNRDWKNPAEAPSVERGQPLPVDETEQTTRHVAAVGGEIESRRTAIGDMHPDWDEAQVQEELSQIKYELKEMGPAAPKGLAPPSPFGPNMPPGEGNAPQQPPEQQPPAPPKAQPPKPPQSAPPPRQSAQ
jgi:hypothetical protein